MTENTPKRTAAFTIVIIIVVVAFLIIVRLRLSSSVPGALSAALPATLPEPVVLYSVTPVSGNIGSTITIVGSGFTSDNKVLLDGEVAAAHVDVATSTPDGRSSLVIKLPPLLSPDCKLGEPCPDLRRIVSRGAYNVTVENENGTSSPITYAALD